MVPRHIPFLVATLFLAGTPAHAQLGRPLGGGLGNLGAPLGGLPGASALQGPFGTVGRTAGGLAQDLHGTVDTVSRDLVGRPLQSRALDRDPQGAPIVKGEILAVSPSAESLAIARRLNFTLLRQDRLDGLGLTGVTLQGPDGMSETNALAALRVGDPGGSYDYAHVYNPSGDMASGTVSGDVVLPKADDIRIGMIDGGVDRHHPALSDGNIVVQTFDGQSPPPASAHGTAIASLLVGQDGKFSGYLPGAKLYVADVFGGAPNGGSAMDIARALNWLVEKGIPVTNISLAGPPNALLAAAVKGFLASGHVLVAAIGNDGPAAPANFPAAYDGVIGVTSVDAGLHLEIDANRNAALFAARGVDVRAAALPRGYASLTGTSYAAPLVAARFAQLLGKPDGGGAHTAQTLLAEQSPRLPNINLPYLAAPPNGLYANK
jgi:hypothetical protein